MDTLGNRLYKDDSIKARFKEGKKGISQAGKIQRVNSVDELTQSLGLFESGEFRVGNQVSPGGGFTGVRMLYPGAVYGGETYNLAGVNNDVLQWGGRLSDGVFVAGEGNVTFDVDGISVLEGSSATSKNTIKFVDNNSAPLSYLWTRKLLGANTNSRFDIVANPPDFGTSTGITDRGTLILRALESDGTQTAINIRSNTGIDFDIQGFANAIIFNTTAFAFNQDNEDIDFRVASTTRTHALFVQGSDGFIGFNTSTPRCEVDVNGEIATSRQDATISSGAITATSNYIRLTSESGTSDDLDTINGMVPGATYVLEPVTGHTITVKDGADINLDSNTDFAMNGVRDKIVLFARGTSTADELSRSNNA